MESNTVSIVPLRFWKEDVPVAGKPGEFTQTDWVQWVKKGSNGATTSERVSRLSRPGKNGQPDPVWQVIEPFYKSWLKGQEEPTSGTPLGQWAMVSRAQVDHLRSIHLRSVEDVANATDTDLERMGMGARALRDKARSYIEAKKGEAVVAEALASKDAEIASLRASVAELSEAVEKLTANLPQRKKPKDVAEAA